ARPQERQVQFSAKRVRNDHSFTSGVTGTCSGASLSSSDFSPYRSTPGSLSGMASPGDSQPAFPHDAPAATPSRSTTVTSTPRSWRNQAVDKPTTPAPTTTAVRGPPSMPITAISFLDMRKDRPYHAK